MGERIARRRRAGWLVSLLLPAVAALAAPPAVRPKVEFKESSGVYCLRYSPDGKQLAAGLGIGPLDLWEPATGKKKARLLSSTTGPIPGTLGFSPDSRTLISGMGDGNLLVWDVATGKKLNTLRGEGLAVESVAVSADGRTLRVPGVSGIRSWDLRTGKPGPVMELDTNGTTLPVLFSPTGTVLAAVGLDHSLRTWDGQTGKPRRTITGHTRLVTALALSADGRTLVAGDQGDTLRAWDTATGRARPLNSKVGFIGSVAVSADGRMAAVGTLSGAPTTVWDVSTNRKLAAFPRTDPNKGVMALAFSPDGHSIAVAETELVRIWPVPPLPRR